MGTAIPSQGQSGWDGMVTTHVLLVKKLRMVTTHVLLVKKLRMKGGYKFTLSLFINFYRFPLHGGRN
jgi:hypothetical protein